MMTLIRLAAAALMLALSGCVVYSPHPVGEKPAQIDPKDWEGTWIHPDGEVSVVKVVDRGKAVLRIAGINWSEDKPQSKVMTAHLRVSGHWMFISYPEDNEREHPADAVDRYVWGRINMEREMVVIWAPDPDKFGPLVARGVFPGKVVPGRERDDVYLGNLTPDHMAIITSEKHGVLFLWDKPLIYRRIAR